MRTTTRKSDHTVFVDRYGRRRRAVIATGVVLGVVLLLWLTIMCFGFQVIVSPSA